MAGIDPDKVKQVFASALEVEPGDRAAVLDELCGDDTDFRDEVESWLASYLESEGFIETPIFSASSLIDTTPPSVGRQFGNYTIIREIGHGGMGAVFLAGRNDGEFEQQVAVKIVRQAIVETESINQFRRERQILASLSHPNIAKLLDGGVTADGTPFLAMEFVEGKSIIKYADSKGLGLDERLKLFIRVCKAVTYAHRNLIIHRDLKPANILVTDEGEPKLLDFGLARIVDVAAPDSDQTQTAFRALTPAYASPEQLCGQPVSTASDIYSLGVVLYELLTGERPFLFEGKSLDEIIRTVTSQDPPAPSEMARALSNDINAKKNRPRSAIRDPHLKGDLDNIILMALRREPERRYLSVEAFADDIERSLLGRPVAARANTRYYRSSKFVRRHKIAVAAAFLVLVSLIGGIAVSLWQTRQAKLEKAKAEAVSDFLQSMLSASAPQNSPVYGTNDLTVKELLDEASKRLATEELSTQPEVKMTLQRVIASSYLAIGQHDLAEQNLNALYEAQTKFYGEENEETLKTLVLFGTLWVEKGDFAKADQFYGQRLSILRMAQRKGDITADYLATALSDYALLRRAHGDSKAAEALLREAVALRDGPYALSEASLGITESVLALTLADQGNFTEAEMIIRARLASIRSLGHENSAEMASNLTGLGNFLTEQGKFDEALAELGEAEGLYRRLNAPTFLGLADNLRLQAQALVSQKKFDEAENKINEALAIYRTSSTANHINYPTAIMIQGVIYGQTNRKGQAEDLLREAVRLRAERLPPSHFMLATANGSLGEFLAEQHRVAEAEPLLLDSYESLKNTQLPDTARIRTAAHRLFELYTRSGRPALADKFRM